LPNPSKKGREVSQQEREEAENLRELLRQHWLHCRHLESERAWFMSVYAAITGGMFAFMAYSSGSLDNTEPQSWWPLYFLIMLTFFGFVLTIRWTYVFEYHRKVVNELARVLGLKSGVKLSLEPTMDSPVMRILPKSIRGKRIPCCLHRLIDKLFRTRYWFPLFYFIILIGLAILPCVADIADFPCQVQNMAIVASSIAFILGTLWCFALRKKEN